MSDCQKKIIDWLQTACHEWLCSVAWRHIECVNSPERNIKSTALPVSAALKPLFCAPKTVVIDTVQWHHQLLTSGAGRASIDTWRHHRTVCCGWWESKAHRTLGVQTSIFERRVSGDTRFCSSAQCTGFVLLGSSLSSLLLHLRNTRRVEIELILFLTPDSWYWPIRASAGGSYSGLISKHQNALISARKMI